MSFLSRASDSASRAAAASAGLFSARRGATRRRKNGSHRARDNAGQFRTVDMCVLGGGTTVVSAGRGAPLIVTPRGRGGAWENATGRAGGACAGWGGPWVLGVVVSRPVGTGVGPSRRRGRQSLAPAGRPDH